MPALPNVPNAIKAGFTFGQSAGAALGKVAMFYAYTGGPPLLADAVALANIMMTQLQTHAQGLTPTSITWEECTVTDLSSPTGAVGVSTHPSFIGNRAGNTPIVGQAAMTNYAVSRRYRGGHPRSYWPFGTEADYFDVLTWTPAFVTAVDTGITALIAGIVGSSSGTTSLSAHLNVSYFKGFTNFTEPSGRVRVINSLRAAPVVDVLGAVTCRSFIAEQRKRRGKV